MVRSRRTKFFGTLKYEHLFRGHIGHGDALDMEVHHFRTIYNTIRPPQALADQTPQQVYLTNPATKPAKFLTQDNFPLARARGSGGISRPDED